MPQKPRVTEETIRSGGVVYVTRSSVEEIAARNAGRHAHLTAVVAASASAPGAGGRPSEPGAGPRPKAGEELVPLRATATAATNDLGDPLPGGVGVRMLGQTPMPAVEDSVAQAMRDTDDRNSATLPLGARRRTVKAPPPVWLPASAPVRQHVSPPADLPPVAGASRGPASEGRAGAEAIEEAAAAAGPGSRDVLTPAERTVIALISELRTRPLAFAERLAKMRDRLVGNTLWTSAGMALATVEGILCVDAAAEQLRSIADLSTKASDTVADANAITGGGFAAAAAAAESPLSSPEAAASFVAASVRPAPLAMQLAAREHALDIGRTGLATGVGPSDDSSLADRLRRLGAATDAAYQVLAFSVHDPEEVVLQLVCDDGDPQRLRRRVLFDPRLRLAAVSLLPHAAHGAIAVVILAAEASMGREPMCRIGAAEVVRRHKARLTVLLSPPKGECGGCFGRVDLRRAVFVAGGAAFHPHCFVCRLCKSTIHSAYVTAPDAALITGRNSPAEANGWPTAARTMGLSATAAPSTLLADAPEGGGLATVSSLAPPLDGVDYDESEVRALEKIGVDTGLADRRVGVSEMRAAPLERQHLFPYCVSCYLFRAAPQCALCAAPAFGGRVGVRTGAGVKRAAATEARGWAPGPSEFRINGRLLCHSCFEDGVQWMETVVVAAP